MGESSHFQKLSRFAEGNSSGAAFLESILALGLLFIILGGAFRFFLNEDLKNSVIQGATATLNDSRSTGFLPYKRVGGEQVPYSDEFEADKILVRDGLLRLGRILIDSAKRSSTLSAGATNLHCTLQLGYFTMDEGKVGTIAPYSNYVLYSIDPVSMTAGGPTSADSQLVTEFSKTKERFETGIMEGIFLGPDSRLQLFPESPVENIFFNYSAFILWGCKAESNLFGLFSATSSIQTGVVILRRVSNAV